MYEARLQDLLRVSEALPKNKRFSRHSTTKLLELWNKIASYTEELLLNKKAPEFPGIGIFYVKRNYAASPEEFSPHFFPTSKFFNGYNHYYYPNSVKASVPNKVPLNYSIIASRMGWTRPDVEMGIRDLMTCIKISVESGTTLNLAMGTMGTLRITSTKVDMRFSPKIKNTLLKKYRLPNFGIHAY
ncbi:hypothetical protein H8356DRAFT_1716916 [Neocallimastix lanati (nom. inval.)]|uniref:CCDC81 HU domain-containing protein n=1 Tax=Neocallimastix californiae TaxID=1754190 RepID=A0A1Y1YXL4_9FUNG|nr:hypothetical protein H8356DRAFT_1716916 [Neocallimastix sp. JGI-2020a]ORY02761.1 hypothetical protein LY90DRAFT_678607 [Neocallimastix californiae]|eukprot:ORY02761.1 hypothetical protein LY90DRAFT_678607 [Neocallimastix californiae]